MLKIIINFIKLPLKDYLFHRKYKFKFRYLLGGYIYRIFLILFLSFILKISITKIILSYDKGLIETMNYFYEKIKNINYFKYGMMSPLNLEILYLIIKVIKPNIVVETGIGSGSSSLFILAALDRGKLYSIDLPPHVSEEHFCPKNLKIGWLVPTNFKKKWSITFGDSKVILPELLAKLGSIDVFFHDSLHTYEHMMFEFKTAWKYLRQPKIIISDDINANNAFYNFAKSTASRYIIIGQRMGILFKKQV